MSPKQILSEAIDRIVKEHGVRIGTVSIEWMSTASIGAADAALISGIVVHAALVSTEADRNASH